MATNAPKKQIEHVTASASSHVVVACKIPNGLMLQLQREVERFEDTRDGPHLRKYWSHYGKRLFVFGPAYPVGTIPKGFPKQPMIEGGYAITRGIPREFWEQWAKQNAKAAYFEAPDGCEHGAIFAYDDLDDTVSAAREQDKFLTGMEPLSTETDAKGQLTDPRIPKPLNNALTKVGYEPHPTQG